LLRKPKLYQSCNAEEEEYFAYNFDWNISHSEKILNETLSKFWTKHYQNFEQNIIKILNETLSKFWTKYYQNFERNIIIILNEILSKFWTKYYQNFERNIIKILNEILSKFWTKYYQNFERNIIKVLNEILSKFWTKYYQTFERNIIKILNETLSKCTQVFMWRTRCTCQIMLNVCFLSRFSNIKFHKNPSIETDRHEEFTEFCEQCYKRDNLGPTLAVAPQKFKKGIII